MAAKKKARTHRSPAQDSRRKKRKGYFDLLAKYEEELIKGEDPDPHEFLAECPASDRKNMIVSLNLATLFLSGTRKTKKVGGLSKAMLAKVQRRCYKNIVKSRHAG